MEFPKVIVFQQLLTCGEREFVVIKFSLYSHSTKFKWNDEEWQRDDNIWGRLRSDSKFCLHTILYISQRICWWKFSIFLSSLFLSIWYTLLCIILLIFSALKLLEFMFKWSQYIFILKEEKSWKNILTLSYILISFLSLSFAFAEKKEKSLHNKKSKNTDPTKDERQGKKNE